MDKSDIALGIRVTIAARQNRMGDHDRSEVPLSVTGHHLKWGNHRVLGKLGVEENVPTKLLDEATLAAAAATLAQRDPALKNVLQQWGVPPLWQRPASFSTLVRIVLEQQVSLASAKNTYLRLVVACGGKITATSIERIPDETMRTAGLSRQKTRYVRELSQAVIQRRFSVSSLAKMSDEDAAANIRSLVGFGAWSADVYLMMALLRPDVLPIGDLGLIKGTPEVCGPEVSSIDEIVARAEMWRPWRSVATRMVWQAYLVKRGKDVSTIASG